MRSDTKPLEQTKGHRAESRTSAAAKAFRISAEASPIGKRAFSTISDSLRLRGEDDFRVRVAVLVILHRLQLFPCHLFGS